MLSGRDSFRFCISTDRTFFLPMCFASRIFSILSGNYLTFYNIDTNDSHLRMLGFLLLVSPPMVLVASVEGPQRVALVH